MGLCPIYILIGSISCKLQPGYKYKEIESRGGGNKANGNVCNVSGLQLESTLLM